MHTQDDTGLGWATRVLLDWSETHQQVADRAEIELFRAWPAVERDPPLGPGDSFTGFGDEPAEAVLELRAKTKAQAMARVMRAFDLDLDRFVVEPAPTILR